jgi:hypothetical protein
VSLDEDTMRAPNSPSRLACTPRKPDMTTGSVTALEFVRIGEEELGPGEMKLKTAAETTPGAAAEGRSLERLPARAAVDERRRLDLDRELADVREHHPDREREREDRVEGDGPMCLSSSSTFR